MHCLDGQEKATRGGEPFLAWGDFHARSRFARSTIPDEKWGLLVVYKITGVFAKLMNLRTVKQKPWSEGENKVWDWVETTKKKITARAHRVRISRACLERTDFQHG